MPDLGAQASEAATRSQTLAVANRAIDASREGPEHPAVSRALGDRPAEPAAPSAAAPKVSADRDKDPPKSPAGRKELTVDRTAPDRESREDRLSMLQSPARRIANGLRSRPKGEICEHDGHVCVWHVLGHMGKAAQYTWNTTTRGVGTEFLNEHRRSTKDEVRQAEPGFMSGLKKGLAEGRTGTTAAIGQAALAASAQTEAGHKPRPQRHRGGVEM